MNGWMGGRAEVKAVLRIAYSHKKSSKRINDDGNKQ